MLKPGFFNSVFVVPILNLLVLFYIGFTFLKIPWAFGFSIVALTALVRIILRPFFNQQMQTARRMQELKPQIDDLQKRYKDDKKRFQQEQLKLYQQAGINPAAGCLFMIVQIPVFIALYQSMLLFLQKGDQATIIAQINKVMYFPFLKITSIDPWFFGFNLALSPSVAKNPIYFIIPVITAFLQYYQVKVSTPDQPKQEKEQGKDNKEDFQKAMNTQMKYIFPILIGWFSYTLPVGLSLYWNVFSLFSIIQYKKIKPSTNK